MTSPRSEFLSGVRAELPILLGVLPFGLIYGVLALSAGLPPAAALAMSSIVFAGSAQFIGAQLFSQAAPALVIVLTTFVVNLRHMLYSASVAPYLKPLSPAWKWLLAYLLTDEAYAVAITHYHHASAPAHKHWFFLGAGLTLWGAWQLSTALGVFLRTQIQVPEAWALDFTLALTFIALVVPALKDRAGVAAALSAGLVAVAMADLPYKLGLMLAALTGIGVGMVAESFRPSLPARKATDAQ
jgi:4-azaleucine resistance transporter AzlC